VRISEKATACIFTVEDKAKRKINIIEVRKERTGFRALNEQKGLKGTMKDYWAFNILGQVLFLNLYLGVRSYRVSTPDINGDTVWSS
jgi:hypothetical protein